MVKDIKIDIADYYRKYPEKFQKIDCLKDFAAGIAHSFSNIFTVIVGCGNMIRTNISNSEVNAYIDQILKSSERASAIIDSLLAFSGRLSINPVPLNVNEFVNDMKPSLLEMIGDDIRLETILADEHLTVIADIFQMDRVMKILVSNAKDAMPYGGELTIKTDAVRLTELPAENRGLYSLISVKDSGIGMDHKTIERIFYPFFTTKDIGKGMGLGLSIAYGIIKQQNGYIKCLSKPNEGTTFEIYLPAIEQDEISGQNIIKSSVEKGAL